MSSGRNVRLERIGSRPSSFCCRRSAPRPGSTCVRTMASKPRRFLPRLSARSPRAPAAHRLDRHFDAGPHAVMTTSGSVGSCDFQPARAGRALPGPTSLSRAVIQVHQHGVESLAVHRFENTRRGEPADSMRYPSPFRQQAAAPRGRRVGRPRSARAGIAGFGTHRHHISAGRSSISGHRWASATMCLPPASRSPLPALCSRIRAPRIRAAGFVVRICAPGFVRPTLRAATHTAPRPTDKACRRVRRVKSDLWFDR